MSNEKVRGEQWHNRTSEYYLVSVKQGHEVELQIAMRYKIIEHFSDHLQSNFHK